MSIDLSVGFNLGDRDAGDDFDSDSSDLVGLGTVRCPVTDSSRVYRGLCLWTSPVKIDLKVDNLLGAFECWR